MSFFTVVFKNLLRRPSRSILTTMGIAIGIAAVVALTSLAWGFELSWSNVYKSRGTDLVVTKAKTRSAMPAPFSADIEAKIQAMPNVRDVAGILCEVFSVEEAPSIFVVGWEPGTIPWSHLKLVKGQLPPDGSKNQVALGVLAAESLEKNVGDTVQIETTEFTVSALVSSDAFAENGAIMMRLADMQELTEQQGKVNFFDVWLEPGTSEEAVESMRARVKAEFEGMTAFSPGAVAQSNAGIQIAKAMSIATSFIALVVGAVGVMNTILMSVFERIREIGVLLAIGWRRTRILKMILLESMLLSFVGGIMGCALGVLSTLGIQASPWIRGKIECELTFSLLGTAMLVSLGLGILGGLYPAWIGSRMSPANALRH